MTSIRTYPATVRPFFPAIGQDSDRGDQPGGRFDSDGFSAEDAVLHRDDAGSFKDQVSCHET